MENKLKRLFILVIAIAISGCDSLSKKKDSPKNPDMENVFFESQDKGSANPEEDIQVYYKIFIDKELAAKTTSGLFFQKKKLELHLAPGRYLFMAERWYLEESPESEMPEYKRANNVWQMKPMYIDIHENSEPFKMIFGIDHDKKEFYYKIEGKSDSIQDIMKHYE
ncbi:MAG: hypothetical protein OEV66_11690 [Spirochaetia bacterium]|nr:hypothetical protein [Spirochaetia bacterium]